MHNTTLALTHPKSGLTSRTNFVMTSAELFATSALSQSLPLFGSLLAHSIGSALLRRSKYMSPRMSAVFILICE